MRFTTIFLFSLFLISSSCVTSGVQGKFLPEYQGVDPRLQPMVDEYLWLSHQNHIAFSGTVTLGLKKIGISSVVGLCTRAPGFREIDIDIDFWNKRGASQRLVTVFHELTHCYCAREHDYDKGTPYLPTEQGRIAEASAWSVGQPKPGRFDDACPKSLMYPIVVDEDCFRSHYGEYVKEMFNRCNPY